ncbi:MAG TPA: MFS transporter [Bryobacteraceae bacterium]|jgi:fucose permease|nr:MFS transporter [Bryobacteraceae bacterium]
MLILAAILAILVYGLVAPMLGALMPSYHLTGDQNGVLALVQALGLIVASLAAGPVIDIKGNKTALTAGLGLVAISLFWLPNAGSYNVLLVVYFILGLGGGTVVTGATALAGGVNEQRRGSVLNFLNLFFGLGGIITPFFSGYMRGDQLCYIVASLTTLTLLVHVVTKMPAPSGEAAFKLSEAVGLLGRPTLLLLSFFLFLYVACEVGIWNWLKIYLVSPAVGLNATTASNVVGFGFAFGLLVGRVVVSRILIKVSAVSVTFAAAIFMAIMTLAMLHVESSVLVAVIVFCVGLAMAPMFPTILAMVGDAFPRGTASATGIAITFGWIGLAVSSPMIGKISGPTNGNLQNGLLLLPIFSVLMVLVNLVLRPALRRSAAA